jgi:hypothetical protein
MKKVNISASLTKAAAVGAGAVGGAYLNKIKFVGDLGAPIRGAVKIGIGAIVLPMLGKGKSAAMINDVGNGMIAVGAIELANATLFKSSPIALSGMDTLPTLGRVTRKIYLDNDRMSGVNDTLPTLGSSGPNTY